MTLLINHLTINSRWTGAVIKGAFDLKKTYAFDVEPVYLGNLTATSKTRLVRQFAPSVVEIQPIASE